MAHSLHQADELPLVSGELVVASGKRPAEERKRPVALMKDGTKPDARGIAVHHKELVEVGNLEDGPHGEGLLEGLERLGRLRSLGESVTAKEARQRRGDEAEVVDELPVVSGEAEEPAESPG